MSELYRNVLVDKVLIEIGWLSISDAQKHLVALAGDNHTDSLEITLVPFPQDIKTLSTLLGRWLEDSGYPITEERLENAAVQAGEQIYENTKLGISH